LKPDLVAPGTLICSARASGVKPGRLGVTPDGRYAYDVGTSMATAVVSGCAALVREHLAATGHAEPSAALVKAILINGANPLTGSDATADPRGDPNYNQGFGAVCMTTSIPGPGVPELRLEFRDEDPARELAQSGECFSYELEADPNLPLRICLVWTDRALRVRGVQNALDLTVTHEPTEMQWLGNQGRPTFWPEEHDHTNNAQRVVITGVEPGTYTIRVGGYSLTDRTQPFALVVSGALRPPGLLDR